MKCVEVTGWNPGFLSISFIKLIRESGVRSIGLAEAKDLVDALLNGQQFSLVFSTDESAVAFVQRANEIGAVTSIASPDAQ